MVGVASPPRWVNERSRGSVQPLGQAHDQGQVGLSGGAQVRQSAVGAFQQVGKSRPGQAAFPSLFVYGGVQLAEIPPQAEIVPGPR
jgi:hypothetical protein